MDKKQLQQRIVGAIVLVALGVIFIPIILNQGDEISPITGTNIPPKPIELSQIREQSPPARPEVPAVNQDLPQFVDDDTPEPPAEPTGSTASTDKATAPESPSDSKPAPVSTTKTESGPAPKPAASSKEAPPETAAKAKSSTSSKSKSSADGAAKPDHASKSKPSTNTKTEPRAWVVQVASFSERKKALVLRDRLRKAKHPTFVESVKGKRGLYYRVRVGPLVKREKADRLKNKIVKQFKFKDALVMAHP